MTSTDQMTIGLSIVTPDGTINLNDHSSYAISADATRDRVSVSYRQINATSPALAGDYLVHSVPEMVTESVQIWVYASTQTQLAARYKALRDAFEHWQYQLAWSWADYSEHWNCNAAKSIDANMGQGMLHNYMAQVTLQVPRFPTVVTP